MALQGKGFYLWKVSKCENGNPTAIASTAKIAGLTHLFVKIADGTDDYNGDIDFPNIDMNTALFQALRAAGLQVWGWHYIYGRNPVAEANAAIRRIRQFNVDGYVIDAESQFDKPGMNAAAAQFMGTLRASVHDIPVGLSSYRYPSKHKDFPWNEFISKCDVALPQVYWMLNHNPGQQLTWTQQDYQKAAPGLTFFPTGAAYREGGWQPTISDVQEYLNTAKAMNLSGTTFWEWSDARSSIMPGIWDAISGFPWPGTPVDITQRLFAALNAHDPDQATALFAPNGVHIFGGGAMIAGPAAIRQWYVDLFNSLLPNAIFTITGTLGSGTTRHLLWTATGQGVKVLNGEMTLNLINDQIVYMSDVFNITPA